MPVHYDPARIRKRFCPRRHDKYVVGVKSNGRARKCYKCTLEYNLSYKRQPHYAEKRQFDNSIGRYKRSIRSRIPLKEAKIAELEKELQLV